MKKVLIIIISLLLTLSLAACGSQNNSRANSADTTASATEQSK